MSRSFPRSNSSFFLCSGSAKRRAVHIFSRKWNRIARLLRKVRREQPVLYSGSKALLSFFLSYICPFFSLFRFSYFLYTFLVTFSFWRIPVAYVVNSDDPLTTVTIGGRTVYRAPSPGSRCEIFEIPESPVREIPEIPVRDRGIPSSSLGLRLPEPEMVFRNKSFETSLYQRVKHLEKKESLFLPQLSKGEFLSDIQKKLDSAEKQ